MDYRNAALSALGALVLFMGSIVAGTWNDTTAALNDIAQIVARHAERLDHHSAELDRQRLHLWERRQ